MKLKKLFITALAATSLFVSAASINQRVQADDQPVTATTPTKEEIINKVEQNEAKSLRLLLQIQLKFAKTHPFKFANTTKVSEKGPVLNMITKFGKNKVNIWATNKTFYIKEGKKWKKATIKNTKEGKINYKTLEKEMDTMLILKEQLQNNINVTEQGDNYILSLPNNPQFNQLFLKKIIDAEKLPRKDKQKVLKHLKINNYTFTETVRKSDYQVVNAQAKIEISYGSKGKITINAFIDHVNEYNSLKVPTKIIKHAKKMK